MNEEWAKKGQEGREEMRIVVDKALEQEMETMGEEDCGVVGEGKEGRYGVCGAEFTDVS